MTATVHTYCRICQAHCGLLVGIDGERVVKVAGDPDHPVSRGYTCSKGRALGEMHHAPDRLERPLLRGVESTWGETMGDLATQLRTIVDERGPGAIACYRSTGWVLDTNGRYTIDRWVRAVGITQLYSPATIDTPNRQLVPDLMFGAPFIQPVTDWDHSELVVAFGHNLVVSHGHATSVPDPIRRLRAIRERGGTVVVADPRVTETARLADIHVQLRPGTDAALIAFLVRHRLRTRVDQAYLDACADPRSIERLRTAVEPYDAHTVSARCDVDLAELDALTRALDSVQRVSWASGTGVSMGPTGNATEWLGWALGAVTGSLDRKGGMLFNPGVLRPQSEQGPTTVPRKTGPPPGSRPEFIHAYGEYPSAILCDEVLAGNVRALLSFGGNIAASFPDSAKTREALSGLDAFAITEVRHTETTELATHVLPVCDQLERHDITFFLDQAFPVPFAQYTPPVVAPVGSRRATWEVMVDLAARMEVELPGMDEVDSETLLRRSMKHSRVSLDDLAAAPSGLAVDGLPRWDWLIPSRVPRGRIDLAPVRLVSELARWTNGERGGKGRGIEDLRLICRRLPHQMNSDLQTIPSQQRRPFPTLLMNEQDAHARDLSDGDLVLVANKSGSVRARVELTRRIRSGTVSLPHSWRSPDVNRLTSTDELDPMTGMPRFTAIPVAVVKSTEETENGLDAIESASDLRASR